MTNSDGRSEDWQPYGTHNLAMAYGYMRIPEGMEDEEVQVIENRLYEYAETHGFELSAIHVEYDNGVTDVGSLVAFLAQHQARNVIVPSLEQITDHVVVQTAVATAILSDVGTELHVTADEQRE